MGNKKGKVAQQEPSEEDIELLMANTNYDRFAIIEWYQSFIRDCPDGKLDKKEFDKIYKQLYPNGNPSKYSALVFEVFDEDNSGFIGFGEFLLAISALSDGDMAKRLHLAFKVIDANNNNTIDKKEMTKVVEALFDLKGLPKNERTGDKSAKSRVDDIFAKLDLDNNATLNEDEFVDGCLKDELIVQLLLPPATQ